MVKRIDESQKNQIEELRILYLKQDFSLGLHLEIAEEEEEEEGDDDEFEKQWQDFEKLLHLKSDYIDIHKGDLCSDKINSVATYCLEQNVSFRHYKETTIAIKSTKETLIAAFLDLESIKKQIENFNKNETYEIVFHIGKYGSNNSSSLNKERELDIDKLKWVNQFIITKNISVVSFKKLMA